MSDVTGVQEEKMVLIVTRKGSRITEEYLGDDLRFPLKTKYLGEIHEEMVTSRQHVGV